MEDQIQDIKINLDKIEHYISIIAKYYELKAKQEFPEEY